MQAYDKWAVATSCHWPVCYLVQAHSGPCIFNGNRQQIHPRKFHPFIFSRSPVIRLQMSVTNSCKVPSSRADQPPTMSHQNASYGPPAAEATEIRLQQFSERFTGLPQDDWSGMGDVKQRKKVQNRLNQRALRKSLSTPGCFNQSLIPC